MSENKRNRFAEILREERKRREWTLEQMADYLGTKKQVLSRYERGERNPKLITAALFAQKLNIPIEAFEKDIEYQNALSTSKQLSEEEQEKVRVLRLLEKHYDAIELLESIPDEDMKQALDFLSYLSNRAKKE